MLKASWAPYTLCFRETAITSRAHMHVKSTYFVKVWDSENPGITGWGECALFRGLSAEDTPDYEDVLTATCRHIAEIHNSGLPGISSIRFGFEMALADFANGGRQVFFNTPWARGEKPVTINGLIWMGDKRTMAARIKEKLASGFRCIKLKIGGIDFDDEVELLRHIRSLYGPDVVELRLDANGSFTTANALERLKVLSQFSIHSIEQPIKAGQHEAMAEISAQSPIPIALDEELIGFTPDALKHQMLSLINPAYIILKPSLCGGFGEADRWIAAAKANGTGWWATSALESDLGLAAIGQWVDRHEPGMPQGLGTGQLYTNNIVSPLSISGERLYYDGCKSFLFPDLEWHY